MKYHLLVLFFFPCWLIACEPPWKEIPPVNVDAKEEQKHKPIPRRAAQDPIEIPETRSQDFPGVKVIHRNNTPPMPTRVEGSRDLRKKAAKNSCKERINNLLNCCKGGK